jgi:protein-tyrosine phosphatase
MAAAVAQALLDEAGLGDQVRVESFGTAAYHVGEPIDAQAESALRRQGWTAARHRARRLGRGDVEAPDLVLCADHSNEGVVRRLATLGDGEKKVRMLRSFDPATDDADDEIPDPWAGGPEEDLAMLQLLGPLPDGLFGAYMEIAPLRTDGRRGGPCFLSIPCWYTPFCSGATTGTGSPGSQ